MRTGCFLLLIPLLLPQGSQAVELRLKASALVPAHSFKVADVAEIADAPADVAARLAEVELGHSPRIGYRERVERRDIERRIRSRAGVHDVSWSGALAVLVETAATVVSGQEIADAAAVHLERTLSVDRHRLVMNVIEGVEDVRVPRGTVRLQPRSLAYSEALRRRAVVWIDLHLDGAFYRSVPVSFRVEVWRDAWVTSSGVGAGSHVDCSRVELRAVDVAALGAPALDGPCIPRHWVAKRPIAAGAVIRASSIAEPSWVVRGQALTLRVIVGGVSIERPAVALRDTGPGKLVPLRTVDATAAVSARLAVPGAAFTEEN
jgi:flagella basal body P-ring formation protein FlgA